MNLKLQKLISLFNERKNFFNNHPNAYRFMTDTVGQGLPEGTEIEIMVKKPDAQPEKVRIKVDKIDKKFVDNFSDIVKK